MAETIEYEELQAAPGSPNGAPADLSRLNDIPMELSVEIGRTHMTVGETLQLAAGSLVELERGAGQPADLLVNGSPIARGEIVVVDERYGLRITEILDERDAAQPAAEDMATATEDEPPAGESEG